MRNIFHLGMARLPPSKLKRRRDEKILASARRLHAKQVIKNYSCTTKKIMVLNQNKLAAINNMNNRKRAPHVSEANRYKPKPSPYTRLVSGYTRLASNNIRRKK
jgi:hypothetical protein